jgi:clan AA aspartic protease
MKMGLVYADIELLNGGDVYKVRVGEAKEDNIRRMKVKSLVDSGSYMLAINTEIKEKLGLPSIEKQVATLADETQIEVEIVGPVEVRFENRRTNVDAMILPNATEVLLGSIPMEDMDVLIDPRQEKLVVNPKHPDIATKHLK